MMKSIVSIVIDFGLVFRKIRLTIRDLYQDSSIFHQDKHGNNYFSY